MGPAIEKIEAFSKVKRPRHEAIFGLKWCMLHVSPLKLEKYIFLFMIMSTILRKRVSIYRKKAEGGINSFDFQSS